MRQRLIVVLLALLAAAGANAAQGAYLVDRWGVDEGLPVNGVTALHRDPEGYLWLATFDGLARFDGRRFVLFDSSQALGTRRLIALHRASDGTLWVLSERNGLARLEGERFVHADEGMGLPDARVERLFADLDGRMLVATRAGVARWNGQGFERLFADQVGGEVTSLYRGADGDLWIGEESGAVHRARGERIVESHRLPPGRWPAVVGHIAAAPDGGVLVATRVGVFGIADGGYRLLPATAGLDAFALGLHADGRVLIRHNEGNTWLDGLDARAGRSEAGLAFPVHRLLARAPDGAVWTNAIEYLLRDGVRVYEARCPVRDLAFDAQGTVWLASACDGLLRLRPRRVQVLDAQPPSGHDAAYGLAQAHDGTLWVSSLRGVVPWRDGMAGTALPLRIGGNDSARYLGIDANYLRTVFVDADGSVLVGQRGVCRVRDGECAWPVDFPEALLLEDVRAIHRGRDGSLWIGGESHLWRWAPDGRWDAGDAHRRGVRAMLQARDGSHWFGTAQGVWRHDAAGTWRRFGRADGLASEVVRDLHEAPDASLWIATEDRGLCRLRGERAACLSTANGLHADSLHRILDDGRGRVWFNSNRGVFWIEREALDAAFADPRVRLHPRVFGRHDGVPNQEGNGGVQGAGLVLDDGRIAFPTQDGVVLFDPAHDAAAPTPPRIAFESLELPDGRSLAAARNLRLPPGERSFALRLTGLSQTLTEPLYFRYRLLSDGEEWQDIGPERLLRFSRLPPGRHVIEVAALDAAAGVLGPPARIEAALPAWWWETAAFRAGLLAAMLGALGFWLWRRGRAARARQRELERRVAERTAALHTQQRATEDALATVQRQSDEIARLAEAKSRFFANVSHELRTPLAVILGPLRDAARGQRLGEARIDAMLRNGSRLERLIEQMLDLERLDAQRFPLAPVALDLDAVLRESVAAFEPLARDAGLSLDAALPPSAPTVMADEEQIVRVLGNLLSNAIKFTPRGRRIGVRLDVQEPARVRIAIEDDGPGIPEDWRERIFDRFAQIGSAATKSREGAGLGLALCREIATLHGGRLWVEAGDSGGARFVLELPVAGTAAMPPAHASPVPPPAASEPASDAPAQPLPRLRLLVAEDNADLRAYLREILDPHFDVDEAEDGEAALALARERLPDLIVSDVSMPRLDGLGLARALRADAQLRGVPLIFLTARTADADEVRGLDSGADHYLRKPFDAQVLLAHLRAAFATVCRLRERLAGSPAPPPAARSAPSSAFLARAQAWLEAHLHDEALRPDDLAQAMYVSRATLDRRFAEHDETPAACLRRLRLERAARLLSEGAGNVSEVAYAVGFPSLSAFSHAYRKHFGHAPTAARG